ncbi:hypothetical protein JD969_15060 [Planctomycetota bacterium]|nr:hypothetical protein JD969_15060 [Planctomycetota bacterium]
MICKKCYYNLYQNESGRCPECGYPFNLLNPETYLDEKPDLTLRRIFNVKLYIVIAINIPFLIIHLKYLDFKVALGGIFNCFLLGVFAWFVLTMLLDVPVHIYRDTRNRYWFK